MDIYAIDNKHQDRTDLGLHLPEPIYSIARSKNKKKMDEPTDLTVDVPTHKNKKKTT